jgi:hypothetical protein
MKGQHVHWCCSGYSKPKRNQPHPLEIESYKKQLSEAYATLHFLMKKRAIHKTPQTEVELSRTNQLIQKLLDILTPKKPILEANKPTPSIPQNKSTQTEGTGTDQPVGESDISSVSTDSSASTETENLAGTAYLLLLNRSTEDPEKLAERLNTMSKEDLQRIVESEPPGAVRRAEERAGVMTLEELKQKTR